MPDSIANFLGNGEAYVALIEPVLPAVTCTAQATYLTGRLPRDHGAVANGWYDRDYAEHLSRAGAMVSG